MLSLLAMTTAIGLAIALYCENARNARFEAELKATHERELAEQEIGLAVQYNIKHLLRNNYYRTQKSIHPDYEFASLAHVVNILDKADFLDQQADLRRKYGEHPSIAMAAALLKQLNCDSVDNYFELYQQKMKMLDMGGQFEQFRLGNPASERRKRLREFIDRALGAKEGIEIRHGEIVPLR